MAQNPRPCPNRAIKTPLKLLCTGVFIVLGIFLSFSHISANTIFDDDFESYATGTLNAQGDWVASNEWQVVNDKFFTGSKSIKITGAWSTNFNAVKIQTLPDPANILSFYLFSTYSFEACLSNLYFRFGSATTTDEIIVNNAYFDGSNCKLMNQVSDQTLATYTPNFWHLINIYWNLSSTTLTYKLSVDSGVWSADQTYSGVAYPIDRINFNYINTYQNPATYWIDDISQVSPCSLFTNSYDCQVAGCSWHYGLQGLWPEINFCSETPTGDCGSGFWDCPNCLTQATCEAQTCYWYQNLCSYTGATCGEGLLTQFCENEGDCTGVGGYWYGDFCWISEKPTNLLDWADYYDENGDYATPTAWITSVASSTTGFFETIGGFLSTFSDNFNLVDAYEKGGTFGGAIPLARSYLTILDQFTGTLPFGDFFIFLLIFTLAVGVFRIVRNLFQLLKFW